MKLLVLLIVVAVAVMLCKAVALGIILLFMYMKGKSFDFQAAQWDEWLLNVDEKKLFRMFAAVYLLSSAVSSLAAYGVLRLFDFKYALWIALIFFVARMAVTCLRYKKSGKEYFSNQLAKIQKAVLKNE